MSRLFQGERTFLHPVLRPLEVLIYKLCGVREDEEQRWTQYTASLLAFSLFAFLFAYALQRLQGLLPLNPQGFGAGQVSPDLAFNTAISFMTNTNWQAYSGESTMSYLVQMAALAVQNFVSAAAGIAVAIALIRGFARQETDKHRQLLGRSDARDAVRAAADLDRRGARVRARRASIQNFHPYTVVKTVEGATQTIAQGPVASQEAIKQLGTNGGGFFNANSSHPFESPTPFTNLLADLPDLRARRRPHLHVRPHGEGHAARLGALLGHGGDVPDRRLRRVSRRAGRQSDPGEAGRRERARPPRSRAATWRARRRASALPARRCSRR